MTEPSAETLYRRLGGYESITSATDELLARLQADPDLRDYWKGASADNQRRARQLIVDFMVEASGGPAYYTGRSMQTSHVGMHINEREWDAFMRHAAATLDHFEVAAQERADVLAFFASLKVEIVEC